MRRIVLWCIYVVISFVKGFILGVWEPTGMMRYVGVRVGRHPHAQSACERFAKVLPRTSRISGTVPKVNPTFENNRVTFTMGKTAPIKKKGGKYI